MSAKRKILESLYRLKFASGIVDFKSVLCELAENVLEKTVIDAQNFVDGNFGDYWQWFREDLDRQRRRGISPYFELIGEGTYAIRHASEIFLSSSDGEDVFKGGLMCSRSSILREIDSLGNRQYEGMAYLACDVLGARHKALTPSGNEGGIDFIATLPFSSSSHIFSSVGSEIRVIGQCKKYKDPVAVDKIEGFIQTMNNVRYASPRVNRHLPVWFNEARGPIVGWVVAHSGFQSGASDEAKRHGIILSDSIDMTELFAMSEFFHVNDHSSIRADRLNSACNMIVKRMG